MNQRLLGCTSLKVSELCLGTMNFGWRTDPSTALAILDAFHAGGGNFIQARGLTAAPFDSQVLPTFSETVVGNWWRSRGVARTDLVLATRIAVRGQDGPGEPGPGDMVRKACEDSLRRFRTDYLDLLVCEWTGDGRPPESLRRGLDWLVREGLVRYVAFANLPGWRVIESLCDGYERIHCRIDALQADYSLLTRSSFETQLAELCRERRLGFIARAPLAGGLLTGSGAQVHAVSALRPAWLGERFSRTCSHRVGRVAARIGRDLGCSGAQVALTWVLHHPGVTSAIIGVNTAVQLHDALHATHVRPDADQLRVLHLASSVQRVVVPGRPSEGPTARVPDEEWFGRAETWRG